MLVTTAPLSAGWQVEFYVGGFFPRDSDLTISRPALGDQVTYHRVNWAGRSFDSPIYYGFRIQHWLSGSPQSGVELELIHTKVYSDPVQTVRAQGIIAGVQADGLRRLGDHLERFWISHGLNFLLINGVRRYSLVPGRDFDPQGAHLVFRAGAGPCICHTESIVDGVALEGYEIGGFGLQTAVGMTIPLAGRFYLPAEYKYTWARLRGLSLFRGSAGTDIGGSHLALGAGAKF